MVELRDPGPRRGPLCVTRWSGLIGLALVWLAACGERSTASTTGTGSSALVSAGVGSADPSATSSPAADFAPPPGLSPATRTLACDLPRPVTIHALFTKLSVTDEVIASTRKLFGWLDEISCADAAGKPVPSRIRTKLELLEHAGHEARAKAVGLDVTTFAVGTDGKSMAFASAVSGFCVGSGDDPTCQQWNPLDLDLAMLEYELLGLIRRAHVQMPEVRKPRIGVLNNSGSLGFRTTKLGPGWPTPAFTALGCCGASSASSNGWTTTWTRWPWRVVFPWVPPSSGPSPKAPSR